MSTEKLSRYFHGEEYLEEIQVHKHGVCERVVPDPANQYQD